MLTVLLAILCSSTASFAITGQTLGERAHLGVRCEQALISNDALIDKGFDIVKVSSAQYETLKTLNELTEKDLHQMGLLKKESNLLSVIKPNEFLVFRNAEEKIDLTKEDPDARSIVFQLKPRSIKPRFKNPERDYSEPFLKQVKLPHDPQNKNFQFMNLPTKLAYLQIMDPDLPLVLIEGVNGSGKNTVAVKAALDLIKNYQHNSPNRLNVKQMVVTRRPHEMGDSIGLLPGTAAEKMIHYLVGFVNAYKFIKDGSTDGHRAQNNNKQARQDRTKDARESRSNEVNLMESGIFITEEMELGLYPYVRGNTFKNSIIVIDEAQNISESELKTLLTRAGTGSKIVLLGDVGQIDDDKLRGDSNLNGINIAKKRFRKEWVFGNIRLIDSIRSELSAVTERVWNEWKEEKEAQKK